MIASEITPTRRQPQIPFSWKGCSIGPPENAAEVIPDRRQAETADIDPVAPIKPAAKIRMRTLLGIGGRQDRGASQAVKATASARAAADSRSLAAYIELLIERDVVNAAKKPKKPERKLSHDGILRAFPVRRGAFGIVTPGTNFGRLS
jgi:hypothetical protein